MGRIKGVLILAKTTFIYQNQTMTVQIHVAIGYIWLQMCNNKLMSLLVTLLTLCVTG